MTVKSGCESRERDTRSALGGTGFGSQKLLLPGDANGQPIAAKPISRGSATTDAAQVA